MKKPKDVKSFIEKEKSLAFRAYKRDEGYGVKEVLYEIAKELGLDIGIKVTGPYAWYVIKGVGDIATAEYKKRSFFGGFSTYYSQILFSPECGELEWKSVHAGKEAIEKYFEKLEGILSAN